MTPVLTTKLHVPYAHPNRVERPQLIQKLNEGLWHTQGVDFLRRLTLLAAPAGYGKTTLLSEWIHQLEIPVAWITFDEADNDPGNFLQYLIASLQTIEPEIGAALLSGLWSPQLSSSSLKMTDAIAALVSEIAALSHPLILVFDDYHNLESQEIHCAVTFLLDHLPETLSLVISTRSDPPLLLSRLRARRQLLEIRSDSLRFSEKEAAAFLRQVMHLSLQDSEVLILVDRTEGWIAGIQMAGLALQERADTTVFIREFSGRARFVIDYLFEEVLNRQPDYIQIFLIQTSILERMTGPLCDAVLGVQEAGKESSSQTGQKILEYLERANLFLVPLDDERCSYRYHHLFSDLLQHRLRRSFPDQIPILHSRAAEWFEMQGSISKSLDHWIAAKNYFKAANLIAKNGNGFLEQGNYRQLLTWLQQIPQGLIYSQPWLCIVYSWVMISIGRFSEGDQYLSLAENALPIINEATDPDDLVILGNTAVVREYLATRFQDVAGITHYASLALKYLPREDYYMRSIVTYLLGHAKYQSDQPTQAQDVYAEAAKLGKKAGNLFVAVNALCSLAILNWYQGRLHRALNIYQEAANLARDGQGRSLPVAAEVYARRARLYFEWNELEAAEADLIKAREINKLYSNFDLDVESSINLSRLRLSRGDLDGAEHLIQEVLANEREASFRPGVELLAYRINLYQVTGNLAKVDQLTDQKDWTLDNKCFFAWSEAFIAYAKFLISQNQCSEAHDLLDQCLAKAQASGLCLYVIKVLIVQAFLLNSEGLYSLAQEKMEQALSMAEPEGFIRTFVDEGQSAKSLIATCRAQIVRKTRVDSNSSSLPLAYIDRLLDSFPAASENTSETPAAKIQPCDLIDPLTPREMEVLQLIAGGLSNKEIAEKLIVTVGTVKAHTSSIYRKLGVQARTKALARAREIHIL